VKQQHTWADFGFIEPVECGADETGNVLFFDARGYRGVFDLANFPEHLIEKASKEENETRT